MNKNILMEMLKSNGELQLKRKMINEYCDCSKCLVVYVNGVRLIMRSKTKYGQQIEGALLACLAQAFNVEQWGYHEDDNGKITSSYRYKQLENKSLHEILSLVK